VDIDLDTRSSKTVRGAFRKVTTQSSNSFIRPALSPSTIQRPASCVLCCMAGQNGRWLIYTAAGWMDLQTYATQVAAANQTRDPNFAASYGAGKVNEVYAGSGSMTLGPLANVSDYSQLNTLRQRAADVHTWDAPNNIIYVQPR
jgi:hypothetical protein